MQSTLEWFDVDERLPEEGTWVLILTRNEFGHSVFPGYIKQNKHGHLWVDITVEGDDRYAPVRAGMLWAHVTAPALSDAP
ncbi:MULTISPECIES: DUF551 domain-containing protein [unclassified Modicisalibacter]|uniref:DUF551 domain-containing protein n=1 Tax=unclassified Modicisalibacter TaxID=2679913 RepID=UPI001CCFB3E1|nr:MULTISPECIES: DUF551 domain-containing protein [unclassified Modicisalibacter]MBZ9559943.1 hypothetical protein [Modicisalibacter sp. R2A 31.J]MBZ9575851.1 hypothetical protein [Modicisalibacter sp. MOD 31.J]